MSKNRDDSQIYGPKIFVSESVKIPIGPKAGRVSEDSLRRYQAPAWKVETVPKIYANPNRANYYRHLFNSALFRRNVWQYLFGGILRALFGIYVHGRYWNPDLEESLKETIKADYEFTKKKGLYGIYLYKTKNAFSLPGTIWQCGQPPKKIFRNWVWLRRGATFYVRINRLDGANYVDIECRPINRKRKEVTIVRTSYRNFLYLVKTNQIFKVQDKGDSHEPRTQARRKRPTEQSKKRD